MRRRLNKVKERSALFVVAGGACSKCNRELTEGWHADHIIPYSAGGPTEVENMQALCQVCNLSKGTSMYVEHEWSKKNRKHFLDVNKTEYLLEACPGAGKTFAVCEIAKGLSRTHGKFFVVVPSAELTEHWCKAMSVFGIELNPDFTGPMADYDGAVVTYHRVASDQSVFRKYCGSDRVVAIFDEIHHCGDDSSWGLCIKEAFGNAHRKIALSGTPFRSTNDRIPFVEYVDGESRPDFRYSYGDAITDGVCRRVYFHLQDAECKWSIGGDQLIEQLSIEADKKRSGQKLRAALTSGDWFLKTFTAANDKLRETQRKHPGAAGLVIAIDINHAERLAQQMQAVTGIKPIVVTSDDALAGEKISAFRNSSENWIVSVKMISEGVDIPRLSVGVFASTCTTELYFRQVVGRFVRVVKEHGSKQPAFFYAPHDSRIAKNAKRQRVWLMNNGRVCEFDSFEELVTTKTPNGYGTTIRRLKQLCQDHPEATDWIDKACQKKPGGANNPEGVNQYTGDEVTFDNIQGDQRSKAPTGTSRDAAIRRLRKDRPDLHQKVLAKELSPHAAMIEAGFRKKRSKMDELKAIFSTCSPEEKREFAEWMETELENAWPMEN